MILDLAEHEPPSELGADICIAGAGAAGLTIALQFLDGPHKVLVLEGGGEEYEETSQSLYEGEILGRRYRPLEATRLRYFGGSTNHWGGSCRPLDPSDLRERSWVPHSGWPIGEPDLLPYRRRAHEILDIGPPEYDPALIGPSSAAYPELDRDLLVHKLWRLSAVRFAEDYMDVFRRSENVDVLLHANLVDIVQTEGARPRAAFEVVAPDGRPLKVTARHYVLALGGIENPRLLLNANARNGVGVGNENDLVGRYFMEHPHVSPGKLVTTDPDAVLETQRVLGGEGEFRGFRPGICLSDVAQERERVLNFSVIMMWPRAIGLSPGSEALKSAAEQVADGEFDDLGEHLWTFLGDIGGVADDVYRRFDGTMEYTLHTLVRSEQAPNPDSRVVLVDDVDRLGLRRAGLDWKLTPLEKRTIRVGTELLGREMGRLGIGRLRLEDWLLSEGGAIDARVNGGSHHMGTTRMADDPKQGVVDPDCRVHGIDNLYIAGSSVFPCVGFANPTLTIVELALRLAEHLKARLDA